MKQQWQYIKYNRINQKRTSMHHTRMVMREVLRLFCKEEQENIVLVLEKIMSVANIIGMCIIAGIYVAMIIQIKNDVLSALGCVCLGILQIMTGKAKINIIQVKNEYDFWKCNVKAKIKNWNRFFFFYHVTRIFGKDIFIPGILFVGVKIYNGLPVFKGVISGLGIVAILCVFSGLYIQRNWREQTEDEKRKKSIKEKKIIDIEMLIRKQFRRLNINRYIVMMTILVIGIDVVIHLCGNFFGATQRYITVCILSILPTVTNVIFQKILAEALLAEEVLITNFYIIRKFGRKNNFINVTIRKLQQYTVVMIGGVLIEEVIFNKLAPKIVILCVCSIIQWVSVTVLLGMRCFQFEKYDYNDLKENYTGIMISNMLEDYLIIGLPVILISGSLMAVGKPENMIIFLGVTVIYTVIEYLYAMGKVTLKRRKKDVSYKEYNESI